MPPDTQPGLLHQPILTLTDMKTILDTKPTYIETIATANGWADSKTGELIVSIPHLRQKLLDDHAKIMIILAEMERNGQT